MKQDQLYDFYFFGTDHPDTLPMPDNSQRSHATPVIPPKQSDVDQLRNTYIRLRTAEEQQKKNKKKLEAVEKKIHSLELELHEFQKTCEQKTELLRKNPTAVVDTPWRDPASINTPGNVLDLGAFLWDKRQNLQNLYREKATIWLDWLNNVSHILIWQKEINHYLQASYKTYESKVALYKLFNNIPTQPNPDESSDQQTPVSAFQK